MRVNVNPFSSVYIFITSLYKSVFVIVEPLLFCMII